jgi:hypothetical protein
MSEFLFFHLKLSNIALAQRYQRPILDRRSTTNKTYTVLLSYTYSSVTTLRIESINILEHMNKYLATIRFIIVLRCFSVYTSFTLFSALSAFTPFTPFSAFSSFSPFSPFTPFSAFSPFSPFSPFSAFSPFSVFSQGTGRTKRQEGKGYSCTTKIYRSTEIPRSIKKHREILRSRKEYCDILSNIKVCTENRSIFCKIIIVIVQKVIKKTITPE